MKSPAAELHDSLEELLKLLNDDRRHGADFKKGYRHLALQVIDWCRRQGGVTGRSVIRRSVRQQRASREDN